MVEETPVAPRQRTRQGARPGGGMNRREFLAGTALGALATGARGFALPHHPPPPITPRRPEGIEQLGRGRVDDYAWLKPANWKEVWRDASTLDPSIRAYLAEENRYCDAVLAPTEPLQAQLIAEMKARTAPSPQPPPEEDGDWAY